MKEFPQVAETARCLLSIPATSVFSEVTFSHAGLILCGNQCQLKPSTAEMHAFMGINTTLIKKK
jgi:hypothetical protein